MGNKKAGKRSMSYPTRLLNPGEQVAVDVRPHWKYLVGPLFAVVLVVAGAITALVESVPWWGLLAIAALVLVCLLWLAGRYVRWATTSFVVTNQRLVLRKGVLGRSSREMLLDRLTDISYHQTLLDRVMGCGDILLESAGRDSQEVFPDLPHPVLIQNEIYRLLTERQARGWAGAAGTGPFVPGTPFAPPGPPVPGGQPSPPGAPGPFPTGGAPAEPSVTDQLSQLDQMRKKGLISRREFAAKKAELLSRL